MQSQFPPVLCHTIVARVNGGTVKAQVFINQWPNPGNFSAKLLVNDREIDAIDCQNCNDLVDTMRDAVESQADQIDELGINLFMRRMDRTERIAA